MVKVTEKLRWRGEWGCFGKLLSVLGGVGVFVVGSLGGGGELL